MSHNIISVLSKINNLSMLHRELSRKLKSEALITIFLHNFGPFTIAIHTELKAEKDTSFYWGDVSSDHLLAVLLNFILSVISK